jgi:hypothetical protein
MPQQQDLQQMERRVRSLTGAILGAVAFAACYALLLVLDQTTEMRGHLYALIAGVLFYLAGDLLAMVWFRLLASQLQGYIRRLEQELRQERHSQALDDDDVEEGVARIAAADDGVEVIRPGASSAR